MVCLGNICRSPLAEGILRSKSLQKGLPWEIGSAGTNGYHIGEPPHPLSQKVALEHGIDISQQRARRFLVQDFDRYDKIYAMAEDVLEDIRRLAGFRFDPAKSDLLLNELFPGENREVPDPYYGPESGYKHVYDLLDRACDTLVRKYTA